LTGKTGLDDDALKDVAARLAYVLAPKDLPAVASGDRPRIHQPQPPNSGRRKAYRHMRARASEAVNADLLPTSFGHNRPAVAFNQGPGVGLRRQKVAAGSRQAKFGGTGPRLGVHQICVQQLAEQLIGPVPFAS
jgi:hypothetical protein